MYLTLDCEWIRAAGGLRAHGDAFRGVRPGRGPLVSAVRRVAAGLDRSLRGVRVGRAVGKWGRACLRVPDRASNVGGGAPAVDGGWLSRAW